MEHFIAQVCDRMILTTMHPRTTIHINVIELHNDGCLSSCAVNATMFALIDAGVPMRHLVAAATCCLDTEGAIHFSPNQDTLDQSCGIVTLVLESKLKQILSLSSKGVITTGQLNQCVNMLTDKCVDLFEAFRAHISNSCSISTV